MWEKIPFLWRVFFKPIKEIDNNALFSFEVDYIHLDNVSSMYNKSL